MGDDKKKKKKVDISLRAYLKYKAKILNEGGDLKGKNEWMKDRLSGKDK